MVGLDEDLSQSDVFTHSHQSLLHRLSCSQDRNACDLKKTHMEDFFTGVCSLSGAEDTKKEKSEDLKYLHENICCELHILQYIKHSP